MTDLNLIRHVNYAVCGPNLILCVNKAGSYVKVAVVYNVAVHFSSVFFYCHIILQG